MTNIFCCDPLVEQLPNASLALVAEKNSDYNATPKPEK
jgi:hypothetical protein